MKYDASDYVMLAMGSLVLPILILAAYIVLWVAPHDMYNSRRCLQAGYPSTSTDYTGQGYCMTLEGVVTVTVTELDRAAVR